MHIGIIPDGNRRWAEQHKLSREAGYAYGLKPGLLLLQQAKTYGIQEITYYGFTVDNCRRPKEQVQAFQQACVQAVHDLATEGVDLLVIGNTDSKCFPEELKKYTNRTAINGGGIRLNFLVNYGWKWDLSNIKSAGFLHSSDISRIDMDGTEKKAPYQHLAQNGTITYKGVTFVCDTDRNRITLGDVTDRSKCLNISLKGGGCLMVNRDNLSDLSQAITMFCPEDINRIMTAIAEDKRAQQMLLEKDEMESSVGEIITE